MKIIIPTILEKDYSFVETKMLAIKPISKWVQIDVIDGFFSSGKTFELELLTKSSEEISVLWDIHLMVKGPENWINKCIFVGANRVIGQIEMMDNPEDFVNRLKNEGLEVGIGYDIETAIEEIPEETDVVLLMARKAGFVPAEVDDRIWEKIEKAKEIRKSKNMNFKIAIDGGINSSNIEKFKNSGVEIFYCGGAIWKGDINNNWFNLNNIINAN